MTPNATWKPLLAGAAADRVRAAVDAIAAGLAAHEPTYPEADDLALWFAYADEVLPGRGFDDRASTCLDHAIEGIASQPMAMSLHGGFTGVAWVVEHLTGGSCGCDDDACSHGVEHAAAAGATEGGDHDDLEDDDPNYAIDDALHGAVAQAPWSGDYDLISGLVGIGVYALERCHRPTPRAIVARVIDHLEAAARSDADGAYWHTSPALLPPWQLEIAPDGYINLGLAHGVPGVVALLARAVAAGVEAERATPLLERTVRWLLAQRRPDRGTRFGSWLVAGAPVEPARSAWCYGDPGVAAALMWAARATERDDWADAAVELACDVAARSIDDTGARDPGLCHGGAGLMHIYNRMWQSSGDARLQEAAAAWAEHTLALLQPGKGIGGVLAYRPDQDDPWAADASLLTGAAGVGLALVAAVSDVEPGWDRLLMVDVPVRAPRGAAARAGAARRHLA